MTCTNRDPEHECWDCDDDYGISKKKPISVGQLALLALLVFAAVVAAGIFSP